MQLLSPSTTETYRTLEALIYAVNKHASRQGHGIVKSGQKKKNSNGGVIKNLLKCSREGGGERGEADQPISQSARW